MILRLSRVVSRLALAVPAAALLLARADAADQPHGRPIEFSDPKNSAIATNLNQLTPKHDAFRDLKEDLFKPFEQSLSPKNAFDGLDDQQGMLPMAPMIQSKKVKELLERKRNWVFRNPDELTGGPTAEDLFNLPQYGPDGKEKKSSSLVESYYERLDRQHQAQAGLLEEEDIFSPRKRGGSKDGLDQKNDLGDRRPGRAALVESSESERNARHLFDAPSVASGVDLDAVGGSFSDIFGLADYNRRPKPPTAEENEAHKLYMKQFEQLLNSGPTAIAAPEGANGLLDLRPAGGAAAFDSMLGSPIPNPFAPPSAGLGSTPSAAASLTAPKMLDTAPTAPAVNTPKMPTAPSPVDFPRRPFF